MKLNVLILHSSLDLSEKKLDNFHYYVGKPDIALTLDEALYKAHRFAYSLILVEVIPPWRFAAEPLVILRESVHVPILALLRSNDTVNFRRCAEVAHDCIWEPFEVDEIIARGTALIEHGLFDDEPLSGVKRIFCRELLIVPKYHSIYLGDNEVRLSRKEYQMLLFLAMHRDQTLTKGQLYSSVWNDDTAYDVDECVKYHIKSIRRKLRQFSKKEYIETIRTYGYRLISDD
jgi:DNA-binding response OmpR family regulator